jgi:hypothetical protein
MATRDDGYYAICGISRMNEDGYGYGYTRHVSAAATPRCCRDGTDDPTVQVVWTIYRHYEQIGMFSPPPVRLRKAPCLCKTTFRDVTQTATTGYLHIYGLDHKYTPPISGTASTLRADHGTSISHIVHSYGFGNINRCQADIRATMDYLLDGRYNAIDEQMRYF